MSDGPHTPEERMVGLIASHQSSLHRFILSLLPNRMQADDVLQETNLVLWRKAADYDPQQPFLPWAFGVARFQVMAARRDAGRDRHVFDDALVDLLAEEHPVEHTATEEALETCLARLSEKQRNLILARYEPGTSVQSLAQQQAKTPGALSLMLLRIRKLLEECIERQLRSQA